MSSKEPEPIWVKTHWRIDQLDKKIVEFRVPLNEGGFLQGIGELVVGSKDPDDLLSVQIVTDQASGVGLETLPTVIGLSEKYVSLLEPHQNRQLAQFRLVLP